MPREALTEVQKSGQKDALTKAVKRRFYGAGCKVKSGAQWRCILSSLFKGGGGLRVLSAGAKVGEGGIIRDTVLMVDREL